MLNQPGAGGLTALNYAARVAPQDGTFLTIVSQGLLVVEATGGKGLQTSLGAFKWLGNFSQSNNVTVTWVTSNVKTIADAMTREVTVGATGAWIVDGARTDALQFAARYALQDHPGLQRQRAINLAMQRGELDGHGTSTWTSIKTTLPGEFKDGKINVLIQMGLRKEPDLPDVPILTDLVQGDAKKAAIARFMSLAVSVARPFAAPPGVPDDRVTILRRAFDATMQDRDFLAEAQKLSSDVEPMTGEETRAAIAGILGTPKSVIADVQAALGGLPN